MTILIIISFSWITKSGAGWGVCAWGGRGGGGSKINIFVKLVPTTFNSEYFSRSISLEPWKILFLDQIYFTAS
jgi:hypothetical protein